MRTGRAGAAAGLGLALASVAVLPSLAKAPGVTSCYRDVCHRVRTIQETQAAVGSTVLLEASYYDDARVDRFNRGKYTSNGEVFDADNPARVASANFPDGTELLLRNPENGRTSHVRVNDFGPFLKSRVLDVTRRVAQDLGFTRRGVSMLEVTVIAPPQPEEISYRRNRTSPPTRGHIGAMSQDEATALARTLIAAASPPATIVAAHTPTIEDRVRRLLAPIIAVVPSMRTLSEPVSVPTPIPVLATAAPTIEVDPVAPVGPELAVAIAEQTNEPPQKIEAPIVIAAVAPPAALPVVETAAEPVPVAPAPQPAATEEPAPRVASAPVTPTDAPVRVADASVSPPSPIIAKPAEHISLAIPAWPFATAAGRPVFASSSAAGLLEAPPALIATLIAGVGSLLLYAAWLAGAARPAPRRVPAEIDAAVARAQFRAAASADTPRTIALAPVPGAVPADPVYAAPEIAPPGQGSSLIGPEIVIHGDVIARGALAVAGTIVGRVVADTLVVTETGYIEGPVEARIVYASGRVNGHITAHELHLKPSAIYSGEITTQSLAVAFGARLDAEVRRTVAACKPAKTVQPPT